MNSIRSAYISCCDAISKRSKFELKVVGGFDRLGATIPKRTIVLTLFHVVESMLQQNEAMPIVTCAKACKGITELECYPTLQKKLEQMS